MIVEALDILYLVDEVLGQDDLIQELIILCWYFRVKVHNIPFLKSNQL